MAAQNFSCGISPVTNVGPVCSGHGECVFDSALQRGRCVCEQYWSGESDFRVTNSFLDCQINDILVRVLWAIFLVYHVVVFVRYFPQLVWLWEKHKGIVSKQKQMGKKYRLWENKGLFAFLPYITVGWGCQTAYAITKIVDQQGYKLGESIFLTVIYILWRITFYFACDTFQPSLLGSLLKSQRNLDTIIRLNQYLASFHLAITVGISVATIMPIVIPETVFDTTVGMASSAVFFCWTALAMLFFGLQAKYIETKVIAILNESFAISRDERTTRIKEKIVSHQQNNIRQGFLQFVIYGTFGVFPYMWNKHDYLLQFAWVAVAITIKSGIQSIAQEEGDKSGSTGKAMSPAQQNRKEIVVVEPNGSSAVDSDKPMHIHGLELDPLDSVEKSQFSSTVASSDAKGSETQNHGTEVGVSVRVSPAMKLIRAMTPSRRQAADSVKKFDFQEEGIGES